MRVTLEQHGGLAAGIRRPSRVVEAGTLTQEAVRELSRLVAAAKAAPAAEGGGPERVPDAMSYTIKVEDNGQPLLLRQSDTDMSSAFGALLDWLQKHSGAR